MPVSFRFGASPARHAAITGALGLLALTATACSGGSSGGSQISSLQGPATPAAVSASASATAGAVSQMNVRIGNFFNSKGKPGPALDIYDSPEGQAATPLLTGVAYGSFSSYVRPHLVPNSLPGQAVANLYALPAGENPVTDKNDAQSIGSVEDQGSHPQVTLLLLPASGSSLGTGPLAGLSFSATVEKGEDNGSKGPAAPAPTSGQGEILVSIGPVTNLETGTLGLYLINDSSCAPPINGDTSMPGVPLIFNSASGPFQSAFAVFPTSPGTHQVSVVAWNSEVAPTCAQLTKKQGTISVDIAAGQQFEAYVYGTSLTDLHLAAAPIQP